MAMIEKINVFALVVDHRCHNCHEKMITMFTDSRYNPTVIISHCTGCGDTEVNTKDEKQRSDFAFLFKVFKRISMEGTAIGDIIPRRFTVLKS